MTTERVRKHLLRMEALLATRLLAISTTAARRSVQHLDKWYVVVGSLLCLLDTDHLALADAISRHSQPGRAGSISRCFNRTKGEGATAVARQRNEATHSWEHVRATVGLAAKVWLRANSPASS